MAAMTNLNTLNLFDGQTVPVAHMFSPASNGADGTTRWQDREHNSGIALGFSEVSFQIREPSKAGGVTRAKITVSVPKLDTTTVVPTVVGTLRFTGEFIFPPACNLQDRKDILAYVRDALTDNTSRLGGNIAEMYRPY